MTGAATTGQPIQALAAFLASLRYDDLLDEGGERTKELFLDWSALALAAKGANPERWSGLVDIETTNGKTITSRVDVPKGDPGNTLSREALEGKARNLAVLRGGASDEEITRIIDRAWDLENEGDMHDLLDARRREG